MGTRHFLQTSPTADLIALNAGMYGFADAGMLTPHSPLKKVWWTPERVELVVTRKLVLRYIRGVECEFLDKKVLYETLTDDTYVDWIINRCPRLFLIIAEIGYADRIFSLIDDGWHDEDLPVPRDDVERLDLSIDVDENLNQRFYDLQFLFLYRQLQQDQNIEYGPNEHIPMEYAGTVPTAVTIKHWHRVNLPRDWKPCLVRRQFNCQNKDDLKMFLEDIMAYNKLRHEHIADIWASYTVPGSGFTLSSFVGEHTLRTFMDHRMPPQFARLSKSERPCLVLEWMHCLADAVAFLHHRGTHHGHIRPSTILINAQNAIAFSDPGQLKTFRRDRKAIRNEIREYTAPEKLADQSPRMAQDESHSTRPFSFTSTASTTLPLQDLPHRSTANTSKLACKSTRNFSRHLPAVRKDSAHEDDSAPVVSPRPATHASREASSGEIASPGSPVSPSTLSSNPNLSLFPTIPPLSSAIAVTRSGSGPSPHTGQPSPHTPPLSPSSLTFSSPVSKTTSAYSADNETLWNSTASTFGDSQAKTQPAPQASDVFSLGCVYLDLLTFLVVGKTTSLAKFKRNHSTSSSTTIAHIPSSPILLTVWCEYLQAESLHQDLTVHRTVEQLLPLVRHMLTPAPNMRPTAAEARQTVEAILTTTCGMQKLCCSGRQWAEEEPEPPQGIVMRLRDLQREQAKGPPEDATTTTTATATSSRGEERPGQPSARKVKFGGERREFRTLDGMKSHFSEDESTGGWRIGRRRGWKLPWRGS